VDDEADTICRPTPRFLLKFSFVIIGIILTLYLYGMIKREADSWDTAGAGLFARDQTRRPFPSGVVRRSYCGTTDRIFGSLYTG